MMMKMIVVMLAVLIIIIIIILSFILSFENYCDLGIDPLERKSIPVQNNKNTSESIADNLPMKRKSDWFIILSQEK